ncbi:DegT/DnrJ/EryC1/StrS family aminotransferase [Thalassiella azotivora]
MTSRIFLSSPDVGPVEEQYVLDALRSGWVAPVGPDLEAFEQELAKRCERRFAVGLASGTAGLHLGLLELGARAGTAVVVPTMTFAATANAVVYTGATPVFVDGDPRTGNIDPALLEQALTTLRSEGQDVAAVVPVDLLGRCADYDAILPLCERFGVPVLEDAAEALGSTYRDRPAGAFGRASVLSFNGNKIMTTGGGGMLLTDDEQLARRVRHLSTQAREPVAHYEHSEVGYNYRLSNVLAALGRAQLSRLDEMVARRRAVRARYTALFADVPGVTVFQGDGDAEDNCWLTAVLVDPAEAGWDGASLAEALANADIESRPLWKPMHAQPVFVGSRAFTNGASDTLFATGLALPSGSALTDRDLRSVTEAVEAFLARR